MIVDNLGFNSNHVLTIPRGKRGMTPLALDLKEIHEIENKISEIQRCTPVTLPDLITAFTIGINRMARVLAMVELEMKEAKRVMEETKAVVLLEQVEEVLKKKGLKSSADTREAVIILNKDVREAREKYDVLVSIQSYLYGVNTSIQDAYNGAKKICDMYVRAPHSSSYGTGDE